jgi:hypothetical protein
VLRLSYRLRLLVALIVGFVVLLFFDVIVVVG